MRRLRSALLSFAVLLSACASAAPELGSIGVVLGRRATGEVFVREVPNPATTELQPNDELLFIDGKSTATFDEQSLKHALRGPAGTPVDLTIVREGAIKRVRAVRTEVGAAPPK